MTRVLLSGSVAYDRIMDYGGVFTDALVPEKLHALSISFQVERVVERFGGCAGNIAYNLALLGQEADIVATAGSDFGRYAEHLASCGASPASIRVDSSDLTSVAHIVTDRAGNQIAAFALGAGGRPYDPLPDLSGAALVFLAAGCVADTLALARKAKEAGVPYYFDPGQAIPSLAAEDLREIALGAAGLFCNDYELGMIAKKTGWSEAEIAGRLPLLVVTLGAKGSRVAKGGEAIEIPAVPAAEAIDPTGAGDAHRAGFLAGLVRALPPRECGRLASAAAAYAVEQVGTQSHWFSLPELRERYERAYGEALPV